MILLIYLISMFNFMILLMKVDLRYQLFLVIKNIKKIKLKINMVIQLILVKFVVVILVNKIVRILIGVKYYKNQVYGMDLIKIFGRYYFF